jgi:hypothetical protein
MILYEINCNRLQTIEKLQLFAINLIKLHKIASLCIYSHMLEIFCIFTISSLEVHQRSVRSGNDAAKSSAQGRGPMSEAPRKRGPNAIGRVAFIARAEAIIAELDKGWPMKAVHARYAGELNISYAQFTRYVRAYRNRKSLASPSPREMQKPASGPPPRAAARRQGADDKPAPQEKKRGFYFDPTAVDRKDLI